MALAFLKNKLPIPADVPRFIHVGEPLPESLKRYWAEENEVCKQIEKENPGVIIIRQPYMPLTVCHSIQPPTNL